MTTRAEAEQAFIDAAARPITPEEFGLPGRAAIVESLHRILALKDQRKAIDDELAGLEQAVRLELASDPTPLVDGERRISAVLKERAKPASIDLATMAKHADQEQHIVEAARAGLLNASLTPLRAMKGKTAFADALLSYEMPSGITETLVIEAAK